MTSGWYDDWEYKDFILPSERYPVRSGKGTNYVSFAEKNYGKYHFYNGYLLWIYVGKLSIEKHPSDWLERIFDVAMRGDCTSRSKAFIILSYTCPDDNSLNDIIRTWVNAENYIDTISVSPSLIIDEKQFYRVKNCAWHVWNMISNELTNEEKHMYVNKNINKGTDFGETMFPTGKKKSKKDVGVTAVDKNDKYKTKPLFEINKIKRKL